MAIIENGVAANSQVTVNTSGELLTVATKTANDAGYEAVACLNHNGVGGAAASGRKVFGFSEMALRVAEATYQGGDQFTYTTSNTGVYNLVATTMLGALSGGTLILNSSSSVATATGVLYRTYQTFQIYGASTTVFECRATNLLAAQTNNVLEWGFGIPNSSTTLPLEGIYFKIDASAAFVGVVNFNGVETTVSLGAAPAANTYVHYQIMAHWDRTEFWANDVLLGTIPTAAASADPTLCRDMYVQFRCNNTGTTSLAQQLKVGSWSVYRTSDIGKPAEHTFVSQGGGAYQQQQAVSGFTSNNVNSAAPASATLSNTAAGYTTLGGQFQFVPVAGAETDWALFAFQVPAVSATVRGMKLVVTGIKIDTYVSTALGGTMVLQWTAGVDATAVSLATAEGAAAKAPRRVSLGAQALVGTAVAGTVGATVSQTFSSPLVVNAGNFFHVILKTPIATVTTGLVRGVVGVYGYFE